MGYTNASGAKHRTQDKSIMAVNETKSLLPFLLTSCQEKPIYLSNYVKPGLQNSTKDWRQKQLCLMADFVSITEVSSNLSYIEIVSLPIFNDFHRKINFENRKIQSNLRGGGERQF